MRPATRARHETRPQPGLDRPRTSRRSRADGASCEARAVKPANARKSRACRPAATGSDGVIGQIGFGNGVHGVAAGSSTVAVLGENSAGTAIVGDSERTADDATAIIGTITSTTPGSLSAAVRGVNNGTGTSGIGVWGSQAGSGWGVYGSVASGVGVRA